jgi:hypothetical protein
MKNIFEFTFPKIEYERKENRKKSKRCGEGDGKYAENFLLLL